MNTCISYLVLVTHDRHNLLSVNQNAPLYKSKTNVSNDFRAQQELQEIEASLQSESNSSGKLQEASLLLHKSMAPPVLEDVMEESEGDQESLAVLQGELDELQEKYDEVVKEKYSLAQVCQQLTERLKAANFLLDRYTIITIYI